jgi:hypothetical protein
VGHAARALHHHATARPDGYRRHRPEETVLYQTVAEHWPAFRERAQDAGGLPKFVTAEVDAYLRCGILEYGCLHLQCRNCGYSEVVAFSCKRRGFCPSCLGRRMTDLAVHLEARVLPPVPIRHWICSLPWGLRALLGYDKKLCAEVVSAFTAELLRSLRRRAKRTLGLHSVADAHAGAVTAVQRTDSALRLNVHMHTLAMDGVYVRDAEDTLVFHALPAPTRADVTDVARRTAERIDRILRAHGRSLDPEHRDDEAPHPLLLEEPGLSACYAAAAHGVSLSAERAGLPTLRLVVPRETPPPAHGPDPHDPVAEVRGVNLHARQLVDGRDRKQLERLCRYITRPPIAQERLTRRSDGTLELALKSVWKDGTRALVLDPHDLLARLIAAVSPPRFHMVRYFGLLSSHCKLRSEVVPKPRHHPTAHAPPLAPGDQLELQLGEEERPGAPKRWAWVLKHVFRADLDTCPQCEGPMRWVRVATKPEDIARVLAQHGLEARAPPPPFSLRAAPLGQLELDFG